MIRKIIQYVGALALFAGCAAADFKETQQYKEMQELVKTPQVSGSLLESKCEGEFSQLWFGPTRFVLKDMLRLWELGFADAKDITEKIMPYVEPGLDGVTAEEARELYPYTRQFQEEYEIFMKEYDEADVVFEEQYQVAREIHAVSGKILNAYGLAIGDDIPPEDRPELVLPKEEREKLLNAYNKVRKEYADVFEASIVLRKVLDRLSE